MAFSASSLRWPDPLTPYLPRSMQDSALTAQLTLLLPATLAVLLATYLLARRNQRLASPHLVPASTGTAVSEKRSRNRSPTVLLVGLPESGKTALFSDLVYGSVPETLPSQRESQGAVPPETVSVSDASASRPTTLVDLPGHPRLRPKVDEYIAQADALVVCIDATAATKPASTARQGSDSSDVAAAADLVHSTLSSLARTRLRNPSSSSLAAPSVLILFTRSDLSTLLSSTNPTKDTKRRHQLLHRCRTALENELGQRRTNMGLGRPNASVRIATVGRVVDGDAARPSDAVGLAGLVAWLRRSVGLDRRGPSAQDEADDEQDSAPDAVDYVDWRAAQREAAGAGGARSSSVVGTSSCSLEKLDDEVVWGGKVEWALASVGRQRGWATGDSTKAGDMDGLDDLKRWICGLQG